MTHPDVAGTREEAGKEPQAFAAVADAIHSLDLALVLWDEDLRFVFANRRWYEIMGFDVETDAPSRGDPVSDYHDQRIESGFYTIPPSMTKQAYKDYLIAGLRSYARDVPFTLQDGTNLSASVFQTGLGGFLISYRNVTEEARARREAEALRVKTERANTRLRDALEFIGEGFALFDKNDNLILANDLYKSANPAASHLMTFGRPRKEIIEAMTHGGDILGVENWVDSYDFETSIGDTTSPRRYEVHHADGRVFLASRGRTAEGGCTIVWLDITDSKKTEARARAIVNDAMDALDEGFALFDKDLRFLFCNQMYAHIAMDGPESVPLPGTSFADHLGQIYDRKLFILSEDTTREQHYRALRHFATSYDKARELQRTDGRILEVSSHETGLGGYLFTARDVTAARAADQVQREADHMVRAIVDSAPTTFIVSRIDNGEVIYCPPHMRHQIGALSSAAEFFTSATDWEAFVSALIKAGELNDHPALMRGPQGEIYHARISARLMTYKGEQVIVSSARDMTEELAMQAELERQREAAHQNEKLSAMGELLAGVAHELNNPLSIVVGYAMMLQNSVTDPRLMRQIDNISTAAERCSRIVKAFLAMARQRPIELRRCSLNEVVMAALDIVGHRLRGAGVEVVLDLSPDLAEVEADEDQLIQVFTNLLINAEQAMADQTRARTLHLRSYPDPHEGTAVVRVADSGPGIPAGVQSRIFEPFFTTKDVGTGTGIGLAFCHRIVESHGGRMTVRSEPGGGARFYVRLGLAQTSSAALEVQRAAAQGGTGRILVVDDEAGVAEMIGDILGGAGYSVDIRTDAREALEILETRTFDAILSDIKMPGLDGPGFHSTVLERNPKLARRIGFVTGDTLTPSVSTFLTGSGQPHLEKPIAPDELLTLVAGLIEQQGALRS